MFCESKRNFNLILKPNDPERRVRNLHTHTHTHLNACKIFLDGALAPCEPAGDFNFINRTRTMLHRNTKFSRMDKQTGATSIFVYSVSAIQQLDEVHSKLVVGQKNMMSSLYASREQFTVESKCACHAIKWRCDNRRGMEKENGKVSWRK